MFVRSPSRTFKLGETLPPIGIPTTPLPKSWHMPSLTQWSLDQLRHPLGTVVADVVDGYPIVAQLQTHGDYGAHPDWPNKPHRGTSVFALVDDNHQPLKDPPPGWGESDFAGEDAPRRDARWMLPAAGLLLGAASAGLLGLVVGFATGVVANRLIWRRWR